jgi:leucyl-tRNA synthetase
VHQQAWPEYDEAATQKAEITIAVQVNGTVRGEIVVSQNTSESEILTQAKEQENVANWLEDTAIKREIYVEGRLVNFVTGK